MNGYSRVSKYHWTTFSHDHRTSHLEGLTIDLTQTFYFSLNKTIEGTSINNTILWPITLSTLSQNTPFLCELSEGLGDL